METKEWRFIDKTGWGDGPWQSEPDKIQWEDQATGLPCLIRRSERAGNFCGYVGVPQGHPWFEKRYDELLDVEVHGGHGGLTYSDRCQETDKEHGICHVGEDGIKRWWLGFDCGQYADLLPAMKARGMGWHGGDHYRTIRYLKEKCEQLAEQIKAAK